MIEITINVLNAKGTIFKEINVLFIIQFRLSIKTFKLITYVIKFIKKISNKGKFIFQLQGSLYDRSKTNVPLIISNSLNSVIKLEKVRLFELYGTSTTVGYLMSNSVHIY